MIIVASLLLSGVAIPPPAIGYHGDQLNHSCPLPPTEAQYHFAPGFQPPFDAESQTQRYQQPASQGGCGGKPWRVAGFGGAAFKPVPGGPEIPPPKRCRAASRRPKWRTTKRIPVIFVHGNVVDAGDWYPVLPVFAKHGYKMCRLWGISYNGVGSNNGNALHTQNPTAQAERGGAGSSTRITNNSLNVPDLELFIREVLRFTGARRFSIVSHSLGVTLARKTLKDHTDLLERLHTFVGIAGANHGTTLCSGNEATLAAGSGRVTMSCEEITPDAPPAYRNPWLAELNSPDETPGEARWMTVYDGSGGCDPAFAGSYASSPRLQGAMNCTFPGAYHNDLRVDRLIASVYAAFVASAPLPTVRPGESPATPQGGHCEQPAERG